MQQNRRNFLKKTAILTGASFFVPDRQFLSGAPAPAIYPAGQVEVFINQYTVSTFYSREGINFMDNLDRCFSELRAAGLAGIEVFVNQPEEIEPFHNMAKKHNLRLHSLYLSGNLHDETVDRSELKRMIAVAERAKSAGVKVIVHNPQAKSGKSDAELIRQNQNLDRLGAELGMRGMKLAMHYHTVELEFAAREFHSFMTDTNPEHVALCYDTHWSYRASGNSAVSAYSHAKLYGDRIIELHLRQSQNGVWSETFTAKGDIDYDKTLAILRQNKGFGDCHVVLEQAPEKGTPKTLKPLDIFKQSVEEVKKLF